MKTQLKNAELKASSTSSENEERRVNAVKKEYEEQISSLNEQVQIMEMALKEEEEKTNKMKEEMDVEIKLNRDKEEKLSQKVEALSCELNDANERTRAVQKEKEEKEAEIVELNRRCDNALDASRAAQERVVQQDNVGEVEGYDG